MALRYDNYKAFCTTAEIDHKEEWEDRIIADPAQMVSDDKGEVDYSDNHTDDAEPEVIESEMDNLLWCQPVDTPFDTQGECINNNKGPRPVIIEEE